MWPASSSAKAAVGASALADCVRPMKALGKGTPRRGDKVGTISYIGVRPDLISDKSRTKPEAPNFHGVADSTKLDPNLPDPTSLFL